MLSASTSSIAGGEGTGGFFFIGRQTDYLYTGLIEALVTEGYAPPTGFVSRPDVRLTSPAIIGDWRPAWRPDWVRAFKLAALIRGT